jgi:hypothetical protein
VLKKMMIVTATASVALVGGVGIASAHESGHHGHDNAAHCQQSNDTTQKHKGDSVASDTDVQDVTGNVLGIQATKPSGAICPPVADGNHL